ncbi:MAG: hypothetical protein RLY70_4616 [Planctomycetota bacterium]|jgi:hypothetical protein
MAARENTGLQAALIIFVIITVGLSISTYAYFRSAEESSKALAAKTAEASTNMKQAQDRGVEIRCLKFMLGWDTALSDADYDGLLKGLDAAAEIHKIDEGYKQDMQMYGKGLDKPNYRLVPAELLKVIKAKNDELVTVIEEQKKLQTQLAAARDESKKEIDLAKKGQEDASAELVKRTGDFETERTRLNDEKTKLVSQKDELASKLNDTVAKGEKDVKGLQGTISTLELRIRGLTADTEQLRQTSNFDVPDGRVTYVNQRANVVMINLGSADGLRPQISFGVYDKAETSPSPDSVKAGLEVTKVLEAHLAEARIVHSKNAAPILPGDNIYSPMWKPGQRLRFALTGFMDIDGDGVNDRHIVRNLILLNNGVIDAEQQDDGTADVAKMSLLTRYLVDGGLPSDRNSVETQLQGRNRMISKAQELGIRQIPVQSILGYLGWRSEEKTVSLGRGAQTDLGAAGNRPASKPAGGADGGEFRKRQPPAAKPDDAF